MSIVDRKIVHPYSLSCCENERVKILIRSIKRDEKRKKNVKVSNKQVLNLRNCGLRLAGIVFSRQHLRPALGLC